jgi:ComF family protein
MKKALPVALWEGVLHLIYPRLCAACSQSLLTQEQVLCIGCTSFLPATNFHHIPDNETAIRLVGRVQFEYATSFAYFSKAGLMQDLLHQFKYKGNKRIGIWLAQLLAHSLKNTHWIQEVDLIVPIPLYKRKEVARGFNQSELIAKELAIILKKDLKVDAIERVVDTPSQTKMSREQRLENLKGAFNLIANPQRLVNKHILIVDDVLTTGATIEACTDSLKNISGLKVSVVTLGLAI